MVQSLKEKEVKFEHYNIPNVKLEGDIHIRGNVKSVWFKDPDGNILSIVNARPTNY